MRRRLAAVSDVSIGALLADAIPALAQVSATPQLDAEVLLATTLRLPRSFLLAFPERTVDVARSAEFDRAIARRVRGEPLAYITRRKEFFSLELDVSPAVLIPRPETELLVEETLARFERGERRSVLDLGTGSGAIALAIKREWPSAAVTASDTSRDAIAIARANAARLRLDVELVESDWFAALAGRRFDAIVCNPPYVRSNDSGFDGPLAFEPRLALDGGSDSLAALRIVVAQSPAHLNENGFLILEHGYDQRPALLAFSAAAGFDVVAARRDLAGLDRAVVLQRRR